MWGTIYYTDLSTYGTEINGTALLKDVPVALKNGDKIKLGDTILTVKLISVA